MSPPPGYLRCMLDGTSEAAFIVQSNGVVWHANTSAKHIFEIVDGRGTSISTYLSFCCALSPGEETGRMAWGEVIHPDSFTENNRKVADGIATKPSKDRFPVTIQVVRVANEGTRLEETMGGEDTSPQSTELDQGDDCFFCLHVQDLTRARLQIAALEEKVKHLSATQDAIVRASGQSLVVVDETGRIASMSDGASTMFGFEHSDSLIGHHLNTIIKEGNGIFGSVDLSDGNQREVRGIRDDGGVLDMEIGISSIQHTRDVAIMVKNNSQRETEELQRYRELQSNRGIVLGILDASFHALFVINEACMIQMVNTKSSEVFGWSKEEFIGRNINMIMTHDIASQHNQYVETYLKTGIKHMIGTQREVTAKRKDGSTFPCQLGLAEPHGQSGLICGFIRDLTAEKKAREEMKAEQQLLEKVLDASFDALFVINEKGIIEKVNKASTEAFGWKSEELMGHNINIIMPQHHAKLHDDYLEHYAATGVRKMIGKQREVEARRKDGTTFPCILGMAELQHNRRRLYVGFIKDVTIQRSLLVAEAEREASDSLLHNILPEHIARRLKDDPSHIADHYENTTVLFADIVGFTAKTSAMSPHDGTFSMAGHLQHIPSCT